MPRPILTRWLCVPVAMGLQMFAVNGTEAKPSAANAWKEIENALGHYAENSNRDKPDQKLLAGQMSLLQLRLEDFIREYPNTDLWWKARIMLPETKLRAASRMGFSADPRMAETELGQVLEDPALPKARRADAECAFIYLLLARDEHDKLSPDEIRRLLERMENFAVNHPRHMSTGKLQLMLGRMLMRHDSQRAERALKIASLSPDEEVAGDALRELAVLPYRTRPLDLEFTAFDGRKISLSDLRGKVVLIDFWATWCGPCRDEVPRIKSIYQRYHDQGFEIVGISLDDQKSALKKYLTEQGMDWPQYFDGRGWNNKISRRFAITSVPTMWLLDKKGRVVSTEIWGGNLEKRLRLELAR